MQGSAGGGRMTEGSRSIQFMAGALNIRLGTSFETIDHRAVLVLRDELKAGIAEYLASHRPETVVLTKHRPRILVAGVRRGSVEIHAIVNIVAALPWGEILAGVHTAGDVIKDIGALAGGVGALYKAGHWLTQRFKKRGIPLGAEHADAEAKEQTSPVSIVVVSTTHVHSRTIENEEDLLQVLGPTLATSDPAAMAVSVDQELIQLLVRAIVHGQSEIESPNLGGGKFLMDWNLRANGLEDPQEIYRCPVIIHNAAAFGFRRIDHPQTVFASAKHNGPLRIGRVKVSQQEDWILGSETPIRGKRIDLSPNNG